MEEEKEKKVNKPLIIFLVVFLLIILGGSIFFIYQMVCVGSDDNFLNVYKNSDTGGLCLVSEIDEYCDELAFQIETENSDAKLVAVDSNNLFILLDDNGLKLYNIEAKEITAVSLEDTYSDYAIYLNNDQDRVIGIVYTNSTGKVGYYNVSLNQKLYDDKYNDINQIDDNYLNASDDTKNYLLNANEEIEEFSNEEGLNYTVFNFEGKYYYFETAYSNGSIYQKIYANNKKIIYDKIISTHLVSVYDGNLYLVDGDVVKKYDVDGNLIKTTETFGNIKQIINNSTVYIDNNYLKLTNIETDETIEIAEWDDEYTYDEYTSGYYSRENLDDMGETEKVEGIYFVINYPEKDNNGNYGIEYCYTADKKIVTYDIKTESGGRAKPILYLYPTETTNVKIEFEHPEYLTTTYPKFNDSWEVIANYNGDLYDKDNKYYYALYWDEIRVHEIDFQEGFYVTKENAISFLEEKLSIIGLNDREKNEFIMYWLPVLEKNGQNLVYFELTDERESYNKLLITPAPNSMLRVSIHIKKVNNFVNIKEQELENFERKGFTVVEWGGMIY